MKKMKSSNLILTLRKSRFSIPMTPEPKAFFVYGSLRPDDTSNMQWTQPFNKGMDATPARLYGHRLYMESYALVISPDPTAHPEDFVVGHVLKPSSGSDWSEKLRDADCIEGYPDLYDRKVVSATLLDGSTLPVWLYFRQLDPTKCRCIASGDFNDR